MTTEEFWKKKNRYDVPGYSDEEIMEMERDKRFWSGIIKCPVCEYPVIADEICCVCGQDTLAPICTTKEGWRRYVSMHPGYVWDVAREEKRGTADHPIEKPSK